MTGNGKHTTKLKKNDDDWEMVYDIVLPTGTYKISIHVDNSWFIMV